MRGDFADLDEEGASEGGTGWLRFMVLAGRNADSGEAKKEAAQELGGFTLS